MSDTIHGIGLAAGNALGISKPEGKYDNQLGGLMNQVQSRIDNPTALSNSLFANYANQATNQLNQNIGATRGLTPEQAVEAKRNNGAAMFGNAGAQAAAAGMQNQQANMSLLASLMSGQNLQDINNQNTQAQNLKGTVQGVGAAMAGMPSMPSGGGGVASASPGQFNSAFGDNLNFKSGF